MIKLNDSDVKKAKEVVADTFVALTEETTLLKSNMEKLMIKYRQSLSMLAKLQQKNSALEKELNLLQAREVALISHIKSNLTEFIEENKAEKLDVRLIN
ncbi:MAG: hypothetical protein PHF29_09550 [Candidatus Riflebacteria bacterium]|nr:hypothetical protein [Candidatus Riflebacteria bacterium]